MELDFNEIRRNAQEQGISLDEIGIMYKDLTRQQIDLLNSKRLIASDLGNGRAIGRFCVEGEVLCPEMAVGVLHLAG